MSYEDDQCEQCGAPRIARSTLCADCLVKEQKRLLLRSMGYKLKIKELEGKLIRSVEMIERLLDHITKESIHSGDLWWQLQECINKEERRLRNAESRVQENQ